MLHLLLLLLCSVVQEVTLLVPDIPLSFSLDADIVHPVRVDEHGSFLTYDLTPRNLQKRGLSSSTGSSTYYGIKYKGVELTFNLSQNHQLLAPGFVSEWRNGGIRESSIVSKPSSSCHMQGEVQTHHHQVGNAAISICSGLRGVFQLEHEDFLIEPVTTEVPSLEEGMPHRIYRRHLADGQESGYNSCGVKEYPDSHDKWERRRERWEQTKARARRERPISRRSISKEKWVETLVVADPKMVEYHGKNNVENYVLTIMNMVAGLFHDASIGNRINIVVVRLILLESDEEELKVSHHADNSLRSFCKWQKAMNMKSEEHPLHHDVAVLLTRRDICASMNRPCETLGLSHVSGMCQPHRSCNINEDTGLPTAFTVTHELGHSFGVQHDGIGNDCEAKGKRPHIMSPQLLYDTSPLTWSRCSRDYITRFLDRGWGLCLDDPPSKELLDFPSVPPGVLYDVGHQCRLQYGSGSTFCQDIDNVCNSLWCSVGTTCHSKLDAAVDGTTCGDNKWCFGGECIPVGQRPAAVDGAWGSWSSWSSCTRSCGAGVQNAERHCSNPSPRYGGKYCLGERKRYRVCNVLPCAQGVPSFRQMQCSLFDSVPYKGKLHIWSPVLMAINPCELHCQSDTLFFAEKLRDAVIDGTPCYEGNTSRDMCINGICKNIGCDHEIDSNAVEDRCGVCHGDSSSCHTVQKTFEDSNGQGYVDIGLIPPGAREIQIEEVAEAGNFLALRSEDPEKYFLNGKWTIQWNGDYQAAGTTFTYTRTGNLENLTAPGPTYEPVWIQLLFQEKNPGVRYQYTIRRDLDGSNEIQPPDFSWRYGAWSECSATCGTGVQRQLVHCVEKVAGLVEERYCDSLTRPDDRQRNCNEDPCPPRWWVGEWQQCSITCGMGGVQKRTVLCIQRVGLDEQRALLPSDCQHLPKPEPSITCNHREPCPAVWHHGNWSQCSVSCGDGFQYRDVYCDNDIEGGTCNPLERPISKRVCVMPLCFPGLNPFDLSGSGGFSKEILNKIFPGLPRSSNGNQHSLEDNSISEGDFSSAGDGSQGKVGRTFVDDFYYDYNFINFHEDLTYEHVEDNNFNGGEELEPEYLPTHPSYLGIGNEKQGTENIQSKHNPYLTTISSESWRTSENPVISVEDQTDVSAPEESPTTTKQSFLMDQYTPSSSDIQERHTISDSRYPDHIIPTADMPDETSALTLTMVKGLPSNIHPTLPHLVTQQPTGAPEIVTSFLSPYTSSYFSVLDTTQNEAPFSSTSLPDPAYKSSENPVTPNQLETFTDQTLEDLESSETDLPSKQERSNSLNNFLLNGILTTLLEAEDFSSTAPMSTSVDPVLTVKSTLHETNDYITYSSPQVTTSSPTWTTPNLRNILMSVTTHIPDHYPGGSTYPHLKEEVSGDSVTPLYNLSLSHGGDKLVRSHWEVGNWTECSTSCGLGAMWRTVICREYDNGTCDIKTKPAPARRCHLRPCAYWTVGNWSKCSSSCGTGVRLRDVQCVDTRDKRQLRPFHCQSTVYKPRVQMVCHEQKCMEWYVSSWRECSEECGGGLQQRLVTCPLAGHCEERLKPNNTRSCNDHPCTTWAVGPWGQVFSAPVTVSHSASAGH
ncbi:A disintegrin and metalloproteinase with thrombospondin motifs 7 isoform X2 [Hyla sarda]|uniref:A disintegrin and metalloproteinase with thrombospondin motifs 7 isoform X2 n=1 Tax=Hyla sarda TaxID=327740 RepID=UPI0024C34CA3|nr:A disintegrin and metalloproteinase with thrombospondin motifs 7 isoform X2 [Hyla sarda]